MTKFQIPLMIAVFFLSSFTILNSVSWTISEDHSIKFSGTDVEGVFKTLEGDIHFDAENLEASNASFTVKVSSINTGNGMKNKHAVSPKWFDADKYPNITFKSSKITKAGDGYEASGTMEIHGTKKEITVPFTFSDNVFKSQFSVNRLDYGVGTMKGMSKKVSNAIQLDLTIPVTK